MNTVTIQLLLQFSLGVRSCEAVPKFIPSIDEDYDLELVFFSGVEFQLPFVSIFIGKIEHSPEDHADIDS